MLEGLVLWVVGILIFAGATFLFHLFPRTVGALGLFALILGSTDLGGKIGLFSLETGLGNMTNLFLVVSGIFFFWFVVGLVVDLKECKFQWRIFRSRIAHSFVRQQPQSQ